MNSRGQQKCYNLLRHISPNNAQCSNTAKYGSISQGKYDNNIKENIMNYSMQNGFFNKQKKNMKIDSISINGNRLKTEEYQSSTFESLEDKQKKYNSTFQNSNQQSLEPQSNLDSTLKNKRKQRILFEKSPYKANQLQSLNQRQVNKQKQNKQARIFQQNLLNSDQISNISQINTENSQLSLDILSCTNFQNKKVNDTKLNELNYQQVPNQETQNLQILNNQEQLKKKLKQISMGTKKSPINAKRPSNFRSLTINNDSHSQFSTLGNNNEHQNVNDLTIKDDEKQKHGDIKGILKGKVSSTKNSEQKNISFYHIIPKTTTNKGQSAEQQIQDKFHITYEKKKFQVQRMIKNKKNLSLSNHLNGQEENSEYLNNQVSNDTIKIQSENEKPPIKQSQQQLQNKVAHFETNQAQKEQNNKEKINERNLQNNKNSQQNNENKENLVESSEMQQKQIKWEFQTIPIIPELAIKTFSECLTEFEKEEIKSYNNIYFLGHNLQKSKRYLNVVENNFGYDNEKGDYQVQINDHIAYRYEIVEALGKGSFGQVLKVYDHKRKEYSALKIIRNKQKFYNQSIVELKILKYLRDKDPNQQANIVKIKDFVFFRNHVPENILLKTPNKSGIKIIDFGSSCFENEKIFTYIQSRFYRAPEILLGIPYTKKIDMWSFGCIVAELCIGYPLFPGENENEQFEMFLELMGVPDEEFLLKCQRGRVFFNDDFSPKIKAKKDGTKRVPGSKPLNDFLMCDDLDFIDFVERCLVWDIDKRMNPTEALTHDWILKGLPEEIRSQHLQQMQIQAPNLNLQEKLKKYCPNITGNTKSQLGNAKNKKQKNETEQKCETVSSENKETLNATEMSQSSKERQQKQQRNMVNNFMKLTIDPQKEYKTEERSSIQTSQGKRRRLNISISNQISTTNKNSSNKMIFSQQKQITAVNSTKNGNSNKITFPLNKSTLYNNQITMNSSSSANKTPKNIRNKSLVNNNSTGIVQNNYHKKNNTLNSLESVKNTIEEDNNKKNLNNSLPYDMDINQLKNQQTQLLQKRRTIKSISLQNGNNIPILNRKVTPKQFNL